MATKIASKTAGADEASVDLEAYYRGPRPEVLADLPDMFASQEENLLFDSQFADLPVVPARTTPSGGSPSDILLATKPDNPLI